MTPDPPKIEKNKLVLKSILGHFQCFEQLFFLVENRTIWTPPLLVENSTTLFTFPKPLSSCFSGYQASRKRLNSSFFNSQFISRKILAEYRGLSWAFLLTIVRIVLSQPNPNLNHKPNPNTTKSWLRHGNHQKTSHPSPHHKLKLHERMRIKQNLENKNC